MSWTPLNSGFRARWGQHTSHFFHRCVCGRPCGDAQPTPARSPHRAGAGRKRDRTRRAITNIDVKIKRVIRNFELVDEPDEDFVRDIRERRNELRAQRDQLETRLAEAERHVQVAPNPDLLDALPVTKINVDQLPEELARALFDALRLEIRYNRDTHTATCRVTLTGPAITAASRTARDAAVVSLDYARQRCEQRKQQAEQAHHPAGGGPVPILVVPSAGVPKDGNRADQRIRTGSLVVEACFALAGSDVSGCGGGR
ncbi:hypothetical protein [Amycolatopsis sp. PS_44_ISF1]|uniref:hypothetical protein n=1 Tax=Amycolatopsis sp. PS_44_ISF1 TaxID=2974917 RepID=UPI0028DFF0CF|nr:hypothetical protein [Amycolatopsis sp. PS_44_ISF1]MDT8915142.1 hypothetical protein [Amycolatopsis sp. PS_44_ISF1]